eukprot:scaffold6174_cov125-Isochrysis_galbana.AAC.24
MHSSRRCSRVDAILSCGAEANNAGEDQSTGAGKGWAARRREWPQAQTRRTGKGTDGPAPRYRSAHAVG